MVRVFIEGGDSSSISSASNTASLIKALAKLIEGNVQITLGRSWTETKRLYNEAKEAKVLLTDLDGKDFGEKPSTLHSLQQNQDWIMLVQDESMEQIRQKQLNARFSDIAPESVFFMTQEMEALILSQPTKLEVAFKNQLLPNSSVENDDLFTLPIHLLASPNGELNGILRKYFKNDNGIPLKYGKLKNSHKIIELLDLAKLKIDFPEIEKLILKITELESLQ
jgi:Domain of unknown function (DUF4276)